jgi:hypothetical protein
MNGTLRIRLPNFNIVGYIPESRDFFNSPPYPFNSSWVKKRGRKRNTRSPIKSESHAA